MSTADHFITRDLKLPPASAVPAAAHEALDTARQAQQECERLAEAHRDAAFALRRSQDAHTAAVAAAVADGAATPSQEPLRELQAELDNLTRALADAQARRGPAAGQLQHALRRHRDDHLEGIRERIAAQRAVVAEHLKAAGEALAAVQVELSGARYLQKLSPVWITLQWKSGAAIPLERHWPRASPSLPAVADALVKAIDEAIIDVTGGTELDKLKAEQKQRTDRAALQHVDRGAPQGERPFSSSLSHGDTIPAA